MLAIIENKMSSFLTSTGCVIHVGHFWYAMWNHCIFTTYVLKIVAMDPYCWEFWNVFSKRTTMVHRICAQVGDLKWKILIKHLIWWWITTGRRSRNEIELQMKKTPQVGSYISTLQLWKLKKSESNSSMITSFHFSILNLTLASSVANKSVLSPFEMVLWHGCRLFIDALQFRELWKWKDDSFIKFIRKSFNILYDRVLEVS